MDEHGRRALRQLIASGGLVAFVADVVRGLDPSSPEARGIAAWTQFYSDRQSYTIRLGVKSFSIAHLGDATILRMINEVRCLRAQEHWVAYGKDRGVGTWFDGEWSGSRRSAHVVVLEEAESRGLFSNVQKAWIQLRDSGGRRVKGINFTGCRVERFHDYIPIADGHTCSACRESVSYESLVLRATAQLRSRLWQS